MASGMGSRVLSSVRAVWEVLPLVCLYKGWDNTWYWRGDLQ